MTIKHKFISAKLDKADDTVVRPSDWNEDHAIDNLIIGSGAAGVDYTLTFDGETNDGVLTWKEDEDYFQFSDDALFLTTERIYFRDSAINLYSAADGYLDISADTQVRVAGHLNVTGSKSIYIDGSSAISNLRDFSGRSLSLSGLGVPAGDIVISGSRPDILLSATDLVGGVAFNWCKLQATNTDLAGPVQWGACGVLGSANVGTGEPSGTYMYFDARANGAYDVATLKIAQTNRVGVALASTIAPDEVLDVNGNIWLHTDSQKLLFGTAKDASIKYDGTSMVVTTDLVAPSDFSIDCGANKTLSLTEVVYDDMRITPGSFDRPGVSDPTMVAYTPTGSAVATYVWEFDVDDIASFTIQLPHSYKQGTDISVHAHWTPGGRGNEENGNKVGWKVDYAWTNVDGAFGAMATADLSDACDGTDDKHQKTPAVTITGTGKNISSMLICNIKRTDTGTNDDTWATNTTGNLPILLEVDFHYQIDTIGSRQIGTK